jgi:hypothetical protein
MELSEMVEPENLKPLDGVDEALAAQYFNCFIGRWGIFC